ncbi:hypothetical protein EDB87DRAFT_1578374 [Lactarius vividus]|nr:hypothetical protein EDB87DRAFT_1578374 [Lactarius vividus]
MTSNILIFGPDLKKLFDHMGKGWTKVRTGEINRYISTHDSGALYTCEPYPRQTQIETAKSKVVRIRCKVGGKVNEESVVERCQQVKTRGEREEKVRVIVKVGESVNEGAWPNNSAGGINDAHYEYKEMSEIDEVETGNEKGENGEGMAVLRPSVSQLEVFRATLALTPVGCRQLRGIQRWRKGQEYETSNDRFEEEMGERKRERRSEAERSS